MDAKLASADAFLDGLLEDPATLAAYEALAPEYELARQLIAARKAANLTQAEVAELMHTSRTFISRLESGRHTPTPKTMARYAHAVGHRLTFTLVPDHNRPPIRR